MLSPTTQLVHISRIIRAQANPHYAHKRVIAKGGTPYLQFAYFNVVYFAHKRTYTLFFHADQRRVDIGYVPKRGATYNRDYVLRAVAKIEEVTCREAHQNNRTYQGTLRIRGKARFQ
jgi:hypothetical protein